MQGRGLPFREPYDRLHGLIKRPDTVEHNITALNSGLDALAIFGIHLHSRYLRAQILRQRFGLGIELKGTYFKQAVKNMAQV